MIPSVTAMFAKKPKKTRVILVKYLTVRVHIRTDHFSVKSEEVRKNEATVTTQFIVLSFGTIAESTQFKDIVEFT